MNHSYSNCVCCLAQIEWQLNKFCHRPPNEEGTLLRVSITSKQGVVEGTKKLFQNNGQSTQVRKDPIFMTCIILTELFWLYLVLTLNVYPPTRQRSILDSRAKRSTVTPWILDALVLDSSEFKWQGHLITKWMPVWAFLVFKSFFLLVSHLKSPTNKFVVVLT